MRTLDSHDLEDIVNGACFLGSGGGGPLTTARGMLESILSITDKIAVQDLAEVGATDTLAVTAYIGSGNAAAHAKLKYLLGQRGKLLFTGQVEQITIETRGGFDFGKTVLRSKEGAQVWIYSQNENMLAWRDDVDAPAAMSPDLLCYLTPDGQPLSNSDLQLGQSVALIGVQAHSAMRHATIVNAFLTLFKQLGYAGPYVPLKIES